MAAIKGPMASAAPPPPVVTAPPPVAAAVPPPVVTTKPKKNKPKDTNEQKPSKPIKKPIVKPPPPMERAHMKDVEGYIEKLYDTIEEKVKGTAMLLQLVQKPEHLNYFVQSESTLNTLSRYASTLCHIIPIHIPLLLSCDVLH